MLLFIGKTMGMVFYINESEAWDTSKAFFAVMADAMTEQINTRDLFEQKLSKMLEEASEFLVLKDLTVEEFNHFCRIYKKAKDKYPDSKNGIHVKKNGHFPELWGAWEALPKRLKLDPRYRDSL